MPPPNYEDDSNWVYKEESVPETEALRAELMVQKDTAKLNTMLVDALKAEKEKAGIVQDKIDRFDRKEAMKSAIEQYEINVSHVKGNPKYDKSQEINLIKGRRQQWIDELDPIYKERVEKGNYSWP